MKDIAMSWSLLERSLISAHGARIWDLKLRSGGRPLSGTLGMSSSIIPILEKFGMDSEQRRLKAITAKEKSGMGRGSGTGSFIAGSGFKVDASFLSSTSGSLHALPGVTVFLLIFTVFIVRRDHLNRSVYRTVDLASSTEVHPEHVRDLRHAVKVPPLPLKRVALHGPYLPLDASNSGLKRLGKRYISSHRRRCLSTT
ncbi:hypothetical protein ISN44_As03g033070 [Arabidopsis suecica]|uniref:Uncharacterized protein n=1 Tax=Arabidopsis suecica TaxID=45249 RepID=A0A8T2FCI7_ARASU|nr:hypothetical protein ISN44_As03g033070 [Arabidopsis suecica]